MRGIDVATAAAMNAPDVRMALMAELHFASNVVYVWTGLGIFPYGGNSYYGLGKLAGISAIQEGSSVQADGITISLEGVDASMLSEAIGEIKQGLPCLVSMAFFNNSTPPALVGTPVTCFSGHMDETSIDEGTETCTISIAVENRMALLQQSHERRYTDQEQRRDYPGDCGFQYQSTIQNWVSTWGQ